MRETLVYVAGIISAVAAAVSVLAEKWPAKPGTANKASNSESMEAAH